MANIIPADATRDAVLNGGRGGELETLVRLQDQLPDDYWVFHSVNWAKRNAKYTDIGEIDFVIINTSGKVLFIEQKNGALQENPGSLIKEYQNGKRKDVAQQIYRSLDLVHDKFKTSSKGLNLQPSFLICLPDHQVKDINSVGLEADNIVDRKKYDSIGKHVKRLIPLAEENEFRFNALLDFFSDVFELIPDIHAHLEAQQRQFKRTAGFLTEVLSNITMIPYRLRVDAIAGCGKSLFATNFYENLIKDKKRPLMVCFNRSLAERLKARLSKDGYINTFHGLCSDFLESQGKPLDFSKVNEKGFWRDLLNQVTDSEIPDDWLFDHLIVDEGQDFEQDWYEILRFFLKEDAGVLWLQDSLQNIYRKEPVDLPGFVRFECNKNYRSPRSVSESIHKMLGIEFEYENDLEGLGVGLHAVSELEAQVSEVTNILKELKSQGFELADIAIISCKGSQSSVFSELDKIGNYQLKRFTGKYDSRGNQVYTEGDILFDSIFRFKGNQSPAVILVDIVKTESLSDRDRSVLFCGMTRATVRLDIISAA